jgi:hypothetical protein
MRDGSELDAAVVNLLSADPTLQSLLPDGVFIDEARPGAQRFVLVTVSPVPDAECAVFDGDGRGFELVRYTVVAIGVTTVITGPQIKDAAARIDALLHGQSVTVPGYPPAVTLARLVRSRPPLYVDPQDASIRWYARGGEYELFAPSGS